MSMSQLGVVAAASDSPAAAATSQGQEQKPQRRGEQGKVEEEEVAEEEVSLKPEESSAGNVDAALQKALQSVLPTPSLPNPHTAPASSRRQQPQASFHSPHGTRLKSRHLPPLHPSSHHDTSTAAAEAQAPRDDEDYEEAEEHATGCTHCPIHCAAAASSRPPATHLRGGGNVRATPQTRPQPLSGLESVPSPRHHAAPTSRSKKRLHSGVVSIGDMLDRLELFAEARRRNFSKNKTCAEIEISKGTVNTYQSRVKEAEKYGIKLSDFREYKWRDFKQVLQTTVAQSDVLRHLQPDKRRDSAAAFGQPTSDAQSVTALGLKDTLLSTHAAVDSITRNNIQRLLPMVKMALQPMRLTPTTHKSAHLTRAHPATASKRSQRTKKRRRYEDEDDEDYGEEWYARAEDGEEEVEEDTGEYEDVEVEEEVVETGGEDMDEGVGEDEEMENEIDTADVGGDEGAVEAHGRAGDDLGESSQRSASATLTGWIEGEAAAIPENDVADRPTKRAHAPDNKRNRPLKSASKPTARIHPPPSSFSPSHKSRAAPTSPTAPHYGERTPGVLLNQGVAQPVAAASHDIMQQRNTPTTVVAHPHPHPHSQPTTLLPHPHAHPYPPTAHAYYPFHPHFPHPMLPPSPMQPHPIYPPPPHQPFMYPPPFLPYTAVTTLNAYAPPPTATAVRTPQPQQQQAILPAVIMGPPQLAQPPQQQQPQLQVSACPQPEGT